MVYLKYTRNVVKFICTFVFVSMFFAFGVMADSNTPNKIENLQMDSEFQPELDSLISHTPEFILDQKFEKYDRSRADLSYADKHGMKFHDNLGERHNSIVNPSLKDQTRRADEIKKVYQGQHSSTLRDKKFGIGLSIPLKKDYNARNKSHG